MGNSKVQANSKSQAAEIQCEYEIAKISCDTPPPGENKCATLHKQIGHTKKCIKFYENGIKNGYLADMLKKYKNVKNRLNNLKKSIKKITSQAIIKSRY
ncbi:MAG: hypothetical protein HXM89_00790 [Neisseria sp.]|uniref:hypothetical protein n=1 Tax=Neisseria sp. TaxID=192066 RepID=UPI001CB36A49|nr:hypothetical protein [Neisseria sp.]MBF1269936.1 hypothetical protein [Neisseria sp.]